MSIRDKNREVDMPGKLARLALLLCAALLCSQTVRAQSWNATAGAQSQGKGRQALAFLPNEIWIYAGDSITWTLGTDEPHSVTFLKPGQIRPTFTAGCPGTTPDGSPFDGLVCVNSGRMPDVGTSYTVTFPHPGNYRLVCLIHVNMTGLVHVLPLSETLPHDQDFYDQQAAHERHALLSDQDAHHDSGEDGEEGLLHKHEVVVGAGEIVSTTGGIQSVSLMRFLRPTIRIHVGETVEWNSSDVSGHTITFGEEPPDVTPQTPPSANVFADPDGARHAIINSPSDNVHSGFIAQAGHERGGVPQAPAPVAEVQPPVGVTRFRVTFTSPGTYAYICAFHDDLGMTGQVIVEP